jgi:hydroxymethylpyrimidine pyrophosphatase-like HAD family hydrolase
MKPQDILESASVTVNQNDKKIRVIVSDIEGCLNLDEKTYDYEALTLIRLTNQLARPDNILPFITVCSGRQYAFVEAIVRMIAGNLPAIFENGCGLFFPTRSLYDEYEWHPSLTNPEITSEFAKVRKVVERICERIGARRVIGKEILLSLHPKPSMNVSTLYRIVAESLAEVRGAASVTQSASAVDISPVGIDKASGLVWLIAEIAQDCILDLSNVAGIGDSNGDFSFLQLVGFSTAPANANEDIKEMVSYCSASSDGRGVVDIIRQCININKETL